jgi:hypothetical protein
MSPRDVERIDVDRATTRHAARPKHAVGERDEPVGFTQDDLHAFMLLRLIELGEQLGAAWVAQGIPISCASCRARLRRI